MRHHSRASGKTARSRRPKSSKSKVANPPKVASSRSSHIGAEAEVTELRRELHDALEQQSATSEVLKVVSSSSGDLQPVFEAMLANAVRICDAAFGNIYRWDGEALRLAASHNTPKGYAEARARMPFRPNDKTAAGRVIVTKAAVHIDDITASQPYLERNPTAVAAAELGGVRTFLAVPLLKENELVGAFIVSRQEVRPFADKQIELIKNFAAQAVIAIENARLLNELRQRTTDLMEALEQQTATSEVLKVISSSPGDLQPVFEAMLANAVRICGATFGNIYRWDGQTMGLLASHNVPPAYAEVRSRVALTGPNDPQGPISRMITTKVVVHTVDLAKEPSYTEKRTPTAIAAVEVGGVRTFLAVPMLSGDELAGAFILSRQEVRPFTDKQIELVKNFAAQAVIAIENARLLNELRQRTDDLSQRTTDLSEALEQQTATSEVLKVISASPGDLAPVFATMLEKAVRICEAQLGSLVLYDGKSFRTVAMHGAPHDFVEARRRNPVIGEHPRALIRRLAESKKILHITDITELPLRDDDPSLLVLAELAGARTLVLVPMLKELTLTGAIAIYRQEVRSFTDKQIALVTNFAAQAVIAIENARLLGELRQSLEEQTATSRVLEVISRSAFDLQAVFETVAESVVKLCDADRAFIMRYDGKLFRMAVAYNVSQEFKDFVERNPFAPGRQSAAARAALERRTVHITDVLADPEYTYGAKTFEQFRTVLGVPILKGEELLGVMIVYHVKDVRPFTDKQIALAETFADQAAIAIENARLLKELRERTDQLEAQSQQLAGLNQQLEQRVTDQVGEIERMGRLRRFLPPQVVDLIVASGTEKQLESHRREITALFCDLRGFTGFTQSADAEDVMALLRDYHATIGNLIIKYSGTLERYAGDGVMVIFNDPVPVDNPALRAVQMALETRKAMGALMEKWRELGHDVGFGIGIAHGFATLGTIGFEGRFDYAAIGTVSNVASRLCDEAKPGQILISPRVFTAVKDAVTVEPVGEFTLKGIGRPLAAYNVLTAFSA